MSTAREVVAQAIRNFDGSDWPIDQGITDAVLDALREHWTSDGLPERIQRAILDEAPVWDEVFPSGWHGTAVGVIDASVVAARAVIAALFEETP